jgi:membrane associated rhomboid family serine protease
MSLLASIPCQAQAVLRTGASKSLLMLRQKHSVSLSLLFLQRLPKSSMCSIAFRTGVLNPHYPRSCAQRSFSHSMQLQRRWMERQQPPSIARTHQQPPNYPAPQHFQVDTWEPPTTWERARIATYGLIGLFIAIWCAHNYAEGGSVLPNGIPLPKPPGWDRISEVLGFEKPKPALPRRLQKPSSAALEIRNNFSSAALSYRTSDYPPALTLNSLYPFYASLFSHFEPLHLAINSYWTYAIAPTLMMSIGIPKSLAVFVLGGILATEIQCVADKAYALNQAPQVFKYIKAAQRDPDPNGTLGAQHVGSSGALFAMGTVRALASRQRGWRLFAAFAVSLDAIGYYMDVDTAVSYTAHLAGVASGLVLWVGWLRWTRGMKMVRMMGR